MPILDPAALLVLHHRLLAGDRTAIGEIAALLLEPLYEQTQRSFPDTDEQRVMDGVSDAILEYGSRGERVTVASGEQLRQFLARAAWRNVANTLRGEKRRKAREGRAATEMEAAVEQESPLGILLRREEDAAREEQVRRLLALLPDETDREVLRLRLVGERRTELFARVLGIEHLPPADRKKAVKRAKDRIDKVIRRSKEVRG